MELKVIITMKNTDFEGKLCMQYGDYEEQESVTLECNKVFEKKITLL